MFEEGFHRPAFEIIRVFYFGVAGHAGRGRASSLGGLADCAAGRSARDGAGGAGAGLAGVSVCAFWISSVTSCVAFLNS